MFRDEGAEPSIRFKERMRERVERTPTSIVVAALPFLITARLALFARHAYVKAHSKALARRIDGSTDLRSASVASQCLPQTVATHVDPAA